MNTPEQEDPLKDNLPPTPPSSLDGVVPTFDANNHPEFIPDVIEDVLDVSKPEDLKIVEESIPAPTKSGLPEITLTFENERKKGNLMHFLEIDTDILDGNVFYDSIGGVIDAINKAPTRSEVLVEVPVTEVDLDEYLKLREKSEANMRIKLFLGRVRSELKEIRS